MVLISRQNQRQLQRNVAPAVEVIKEEAPKAEAAPKEEAAPATEAPKEEQKSESSTEKK